jgi:hypothetical protein
MDVYPAVIVHGLADARAALAPGLPVTLLSAPGAGLYAGCLWWRDLLAQALGESPSVPMIDMLDCADGSGQAMAALRVGVVRLVLWPTAPGWAAVEQIARRQGGCVLPEAPAALDLAASGAMPHLPVWLQVRSAIRDRGAGLR